MTKTSTSSSPAKSCVRSSWCRSSCRPATSQADQRARAPRIERIAAETNGITADTALRLGKALNASARLRLNLQNRYDWRWRGRARSGGRLSGSCLY